MYTSLKLQRPKTKPLFLPGTQSKAVLQQKLVNLTQPAQVQLKQRQIWWHGSETGLYKPPRNLMPFFFSFFFSPLLLSFFVCLKSVSSHDAISLQLQHWQIFSFWSLWANLLLAVVCYKKKHSKSTSSLSQFCVNKHYPSSLTTRHLRSLNIPQISAEFQNMKEHASNSYLVTKYIYSPCS